MSKPIIKGGQGRETPSVEFAAMVVIVCISVVGLAVVTVIVRWSSG